MGVEQELLPGVIGVRLVDPEDPCALGMKLTLIHQFIDRAPRQEGWIELKQRLRPERSRIQIGLYPIRNTGVCDLDETACVA
jgi:hypothetical protein